MSTWVKKGESLLNEINNTKLSGDEIALWFLGQVGFIAKFGERVIYIDPVLSDIVDNGKSVRLYEPPFDGSEAKGDYIFCTHGHIDHFEPGSVSRILANNPGCKVVIPAGIRGMVLDAGIDESRIITLMPGEGASFDDFFVEAFSEAHPVHVLDKDDDQMAVGYAFSYKGIKFAHLGDTYLTGELFRELKEIGELDALMVPINGTDYFRDSLGFIGNISAEEGVRLAKELGIKLSIPTHFDMIEGNTADPYRFEREMNRIYPEGCFKIFKIGERLIYKKTEN